MSTKSANEETKELSQTTQLNQPQKLPIPVDNPKSEQNTLVKSLLGRTVFVKGSISAKGPMRVYGRVEGTIALDPKEKQTLEIGESGIVDGNGFADKIIISGVWNGDVCAHQVIVKQTGSVNGDIFTDDIVIEDGAHFSGKLKMQQEDIFKHHTIPSLHDENNSKSSVFGFLTKKSHDNSHVDAAIIRDLHDGENISDDLIQTSSAQGSQSECSVIGESVVISGMLISEENLVFHGVLEGDACFKSNSLGVGAHARIKGNIYAKSAVVVFGEVKGHIHAGEKVTVKKPGNVHGKISSPRVSTEKGAVLNVEMDEMESQNIDEILSSIIGSTAVLEYSKHHDEAKSKAKADDSVERVSSHGKDTARPIFYPRS